MANGNFFKDALGKARQKLEGFLYREEAAAAAPMPSMSDDRYPPETMYPQQNPGYAQQQSAPGYMQQGAMTGYAPQNPAYAQAPVYQQQYAQQPAQIPVQPQQNHAGRNRRADRTPMQQESGNVVDFTAYQQQGQPAAAPQQPAPAAAAAPAAAPAVANARIINARGMGDCRSAITLLRNGDTVLIVLENVSDPAEMRRLVDTLSGACYSLTATITKVSRYGVYLLAPQTMAVYADQATNQMNVAPARAAAAMRTPMAQPTAYAAPQRAAYPQSTAYQPAAPAAQTNPYAPAQQSAFTQRSAMPEEAGQPFYARTAPQGAQLPTFSSQPAGYGYAPDEGAAVDQ